MSRVACCDVVDLFEVISGVAALREARSAVVAGETDIASMEVDCILVFRTSIFP